MLLDYHTKVLARCKISARDIENRILSSGMALQPAESGYIGFRVHALPPHTA